MISSNDLNAESTRKHFTGQVVHGVVANAGLNLNWAPVRLPSATDRYSSEKYSIRDFLSLNSGIII
ncbi:hypothetical protein DAPPUDRAFT_241134 [Daphnia pulex]|uniref:Uncharacterized protein n=1 Tax=Daphnia pulex TaxID=6669 RepID=E9GDH7_DAPPU|nr:hypothetical protein DAPPUDRAFT_241134 [Daphnia pulex]|eukprot:EFX82474.1 hypothetical protein DAPPUDRAFT_241134 [Daphnia pulex]